MADLSVTISIPDARVDDAIAALRQAYGTKSDGTDYTPAELRTFFKEEVLGILKEYWKDYQEANKDDLPVT